MNKKWISKLEECIVHFIIDLEYPKGVHDLRNDYPLASEIIEINKVSILIQNFNNEVKYV